MGNIFTIVLIGLAFVWGFWLIFKRDLMSVNLGKLVSYFIGVVLTLLVVWMITTKFLPWWTLRLINDTQQSQNVQAVDTAVQNIWKEAMSNETIVNTAVPVQPPAPISDAPADTTNPEPITSQSVGRQTHTVQSGETLYKLSKDYGVTVIAIQQANNMNSEIIQVGQELTIPATP